MKIRDLFVRIGFDVDDKELKRLDKGIGQLKSSIKGLTVAFAAAGAGMLFFVREAGKLEQTEIAFTTMLGSAEKAKEVLSDLYAFAAKTPFKIPEVETNAKLLLGMGIEADNLIPTMKALGDVSAGLSVPLGRLALNYGQVKAQTKLTGRELRDFAIAGVPLLAELAKMMNIAEKEVAEMVSRGEIGFPIVEQAFKNMTSEGGKFNDLMIKQSKSLFGLWSNLLDFLIIYSRRVGKTLLPQAKSMVKFALDYLEANKKLIKTKAVEFFKNLARAMEWAFRVIRGMFITIKSMTDLFGGLERVIKAAAIAMAIFVGAQVLMGIGNIILALNEMIHTYAKLGRVALFTNLKMLAMPLLVGIAVAALLLILDDLKAYFEGRDSITGLILEAFEKKFPVAFEKTMAGLRVLKQTFLDIGNVIASIAAMIAGLATFDWELASIGAKEFGKTAAKLALGGLKYSPAGLAVRGGSAAGQAISNMINAPVTITVPPGTPPEEVGPRIQAGFREAFSDILRGTFLATEPRQY